MTNDKGAEHAWQAYKEANPPRGQAQYYYADNAEYWKAGYAAGRAEVLAEVVPVLEFYSSQGAAMANGECIQDGGEQARALLERLKNA